MKALITRSILCGAALALLLVCGAQARAAEPWSTKLDGAVRFYQRTEVGVLVVGTEKSLYGLDGETGDVLWRRKDARLDETDVAEVPGTDVLLITLESGGKTRLEAADVMTGDALWRSDKVRGAVMQTAFDPGPGLLAAVFARDAKGKPRAGFKRKPELHVFDMRSGEELWKRELESEVEMMPVAWGEDGDKVVTAGQPLEGMGLGFGEGHTGAPSRGEHRALHRLETRTGLTPGHVRSVLRQALMSLGVRAPEVDPSSGR